MLLMTGHHSTQPPGQCSWNHAWSGISLERRKCTSMPRLNRNGGTGIMSAGWGIFFYPNGWNKGNWWPISAGIPWNNLGKDWPIHQMATSKPRKIVMLGPLVPVALERLCLSSFFYFCKAWEDLNAINCIWFTTARFDFWGTRWHILRLRLKITRTNGIRPKLTEPIPLKGKPGLQRINRKGHLQAENYSTSQVIDKNTLYKTMISATYSAIPDDWTSCQLELKGITMNLRQSFEVWKTNKQE